MRLLPVSPLKKVRGVNTEQGPSEQWLTNSMIMVDNWLKGGRKSLELWMEADGGGGGAKMHEDSPPGNMWLAQCLNASDRQKNTSGWYGK